MAALVTIWNMALSHLGADAVIASPDDDSVEASHCARFYPIARAEALEAHTWTWAKKRATLAQVANPSTVWTYAYALPSDCLGPVRVLQQNSVANFISWPWTSPVTADELVLWTERGSADFEVEGQVLLTHEPDAVLLYTQDITDTTKFSASFTVMLSYLLASYLAGPIIKGDAGATAALRLRGLAARVKGEAAAADANGSAERADHVPEHLRRR